MTWPSLLTPTFWFSVTPPPFLSWIDKTVLIVSVALVILGIFVSVARLRKDLHALYRKAYATIGSTLLTTGLIALVLYFFTAERIPYLSMRIWWIPLLAWFIYRGVKLYQYLWKEVPSIQQSRAERDAYTKWLPKKKR